MTSLHRHLVAATLLTSWAAFAQAPAGAPPGSTGLCNDGTYYSNPVKRGACHGHKGVKDWYGAQNDEKGLGNTTPTTVAPTQTPSAAPTTPAPSSTPAPEAVAAPGGGAGQVWGNTKTKVYHCPSDRWYGKTKHGEYMSEADAKAKGFHADHGKACQ